MISTFPYKTKQIFFLLTKWTVVFAAFYFIYNKLTHYQYSNFSEIASIETRYSIFTLKNSSILILLSVFNWFLEIKKWQLLASVISPISFLTALKHTLSGLTASIFSPFKLTDYIVKVAYFEKPHRNTIIFLNSISNLSQMLVTLIFGSIGSFIFFMRYHRNLSVVIRDYLILLLIVVIVLFGYVHTKNYYNNSKVLAKIKKYFSLIPKSIQHCVFLFSLARYLLFSFQCYFLMYIFKFNLSYFDAMIGITTFYFLSSILPIIAIFDVVIKGSIAIYIFTYFNINPLLITLVITIMWLLNTVMPTIIGSYYVIIFNFESPKNT